MFVYDVVLVSCKKITNFGGDPNIQGARAVFKLGKPFFKKENLLKLLEQVAGLYWLLLHFSLTTNSYTSAANLIRLGSAFVALACSIHE